MNLLLLPFIVALLFGSANGEQHPQFHWDEAKLSRSGIPLLHLNFPSLQSYDVAHLEVSDLVRDFIKQPYDRNNEATCIFNGKLEAEEDVEIALTGCPGAEKFEVQFFSSRSNDTMFLVENGETTPLRELPGTFKDVVVNLPRDKLLKAGLDLAPTDRYVPSRLYGNINVFWERSFQLKFGSQAVARAVSITNFMRGRYRLTGTIGLGTEIIWTVKKCQYKSSSTIEATSYHLKKIGIWSKNEPLSIHSHLWLAHDNTPNDNVIGRAYPSTVCNGRKYTFPLTWRSVRVSITEYNSRGDSVTAVTMAHELAHSLGINHDYLSLSPKVKRTYQGKQCANIGGFMDHLIIRYRWSPCSRADLKTSYRSGRLNCLGRPRAPTPAPPKPCNGDCCSFCQYISARQCASGMTGMCCKTCQNKN